VKDLPRSREAAKVGEAGGGSFRSYDFLFTRFLPALKSAGTTDEQVRVLLIENPKRALTPAVRKMSQ